MKIGVDIRCLMDKYYSGISEFTYNLISHLLEIDSKNQYFLFYNSAQQQSVPIFTSSNIIYKEYKYPNKIFNLSMRFLKKPAVDKLIGGVDLFLIPSFLFLHLSKECKKLLVVHDLSFELYPEFFTLKKRLWHNLINPKKFCVDADKIIAISQNTKNDIINFYGINPGKIKVIHQGINNIFFQPVNEVERKAVISKYQLPDKYIFYLGNLEPRKNNFTLIAAFEKIQDNNLFLVIAGSPAWKYKDIYQKYLKSRAKSRIKFLGYVDAKDKPVLYSLAKIFVYPSIYEGFGLPPVEAMACGTPVITSFSSSLPEAVGSCGLMFDPYNYNELAKLITSVLSDKNLSNMLSQKGKAQSQKFNWQTQAKIFLSVIDEM